MQGAAIEVELAGVDRVNLDGSQLPAGTASREGALGAAANIAVRELGVGVEVMLVRGVGPQ